jgi:hypothetical protein
MKQALTTTVHLLNILIMLFILKVILGFGLALVALMTSSIATKLI